MTDSIKARVIAAVAALLLTAVAYGTTPLTPENNGLGFDGAFYAAMAGHPQLRPELAYVGPWAYRVAAPAIIARLPWDTLTNFRVAGFVASAASVFLMFLILEAVGLSAPSCAIGVVLYSGVFWAIKFASYTPGYIDAETQLCLLAIIYLTISGRFLPLVAMFVISVLVKESLIAFVPFAAAALNRQRRGHFDTRTGAIGAALILAPLMAIAVIHGVVTTMTALDSGAELREQIRVLGTLDYWPVLLHSLWSGLGLLFIVALFHPRPWIRFAREHYEWTVYSMVAVALVFGGRDKGRLFLYLLPAAVMFSVMAIDDLQLLKRGARGIACLAMLLLAHLFIGNHLSPIGTHDEYLAKLVPEHSDGTFLPYLRRNLAITVAVLGASWLLLRQPSLKE